MYIWLGIDVDNQLSDIRSKAKIIEKNLSFSNSNFTLPLHISLKMSFNIDESLFNNVLSDIECIYKNISSFVVKIKGIENAGNICWILMEKSKELNQIHDRINELFLEKYDIPLHEYDLDYKFHTTLFMDEDKSKVNKAYESINNVLLPKNLKINKMIIGKSPTGELGTYKIMREYFLET